MGSRGLQKYARLILLLIPFAVPLLMGLIEEVCGRVMGLNYAFGAVFVVSLLALYVWEVTSVISCRKRGSVWHELFLFHVVRIPIFVMAWLIYIVGLALISLSVNGFDGVQ